MSRSFGFWKVNIKSCEREKEHVDCLLNWEFFFLIFKLLFPIKVLVNTNSVKQRLRRIKKKTGNVSWFFLKDYANYNGYVKYNS